MKVIVFDSTSRPTYQPICKPSQYVARIHTDKSHQRRSANDLIDGSHRVISIPRSADEAISRVPYTAAVKEGDRTTFQASRPALIPPHCLNVQEAASNYAIRLYPRSTGKMRIPPHRIWPSVPSNFSEPESPRVPPMTSRSPCTHAAHLNRTNTLFFSRPRPSLQPAISWTTHQQHPLMPRGSLKQRGITGRMDCGRTTCRAQASGCRPISSSRKVLLLLPLDYPLG